MTDSRLRAKFAIAALIALTIAGVVLISRTGDGPTATATDRSRVARIQLMRLGIALRRLNDDCGRYPTTDEGLDSLVWNPGITNWNGPYVDTLMKDTWIDPWGKHYAYSFVSNRAFLFTPGPDRTPYTTNDLVCPYFRMRPEDRIDEALKRRSRDMNDGSDAVPTPSTEAADAHS
jgi:general secretion pathway protein G